MPAFTANAVQALSDIFFAKAEEVRDIWDHRISDNTPPTSSAEMNYEYEDSDIDLANAHMQLCASTEDSMLPSALQSPLPTPPSTPPRGRKMPREEPEARSSEPDLVSGAVVDVYRTLSLAVFDVMGLAGFDYPFNALQVHVSIFDHATLANTH